MSGVWFDVGNGRTAHITWEIVEAAVRDLLLGLKKGNEQALSDWGFNVTTAAAAKPATKAKA